MASRRPNRPPLTFLVTLAALTAPFLLCGCGMYGYGPVEDRSAYVSAMPTPDGARGVFTYHRFTYRPAEGWRAFPDGGIPKYLRDESAVCVYDIDAGRSRTALILENEKWADGQGSPYVVHVTNGMAVLNIGGQLRDDLARMEREYLLLDLGTLEVSRLPLLEELGEMGLELGHYYLVDDIGTIIVVALPRDKADKLRNWTRDESVPKDIWVRRPDGEYEKAAEAIHYYGFTDGLVHYYSGDMHMYMVYDTATGRSMQGGKYPPSAPAKSVDLSVRDSGRKLSVGRRGPDGWTYTDLRLDPEDMF